MAKQIFGQIGRLKKEKIQEYVELHQAVWPDVLKTIKECNLEHYSIFLKGDLVFAYFEYTGIDYEADMEKMAADETTLLPGPVLRSMTRTAKRLFMWT